MTDAAAPKERNTIRTWALVAVAVSSIFTIAISFWLINILSGQDWCTRALGAAKYAEGRPEVAIKACFDLMGQQVSTLGKALLISIGVQALSLLVLIVIVLAGGRVSLSGNSKGVALDIGKDGKVAGARRVAEAAADEQGEIEREVAAAPSAPAEPPKKPDDDFDRETA